MYRCNFVINIISKNETMKEELKVVSAPERFYLEYIMDTTPQNDSVKKADLIIWDTERAPEDIQSTLSFIHANKNEMRTLCTYKTPLFDLDGSVMGTVGLAHDITKEK